ncbi:MAG: glutathione synthase [bacterium]
MTKRLLMVMDPIESINIKKDSSFAMLLEAQKRGYELHITSTSGLSVYGNQPKCLAQAVRVKDDLNAWFEYPDTAQMKALTDFDVVLMRKDPPFDMEYINCTYVLQLAHDQGTLVVNNPTALRDCNEKVFVSQFAELSADFLFSARADEIKEFINKHGDCVVKPLDGMGGSSIFRVSPDDPNLNVILETITEFGQKMIMAQCYVNEIDKGDKRVLIVDGQAVDYVLARIPADDDFRGNLAKGGTGVGMPISVRERHIAEIVGKELSKRGVLFAGIDVIGDYLTEVNITSPTCIRELDAQFGLNISAQLFDAIEKRLTNA